VDLHIAPVPRAELEDAKGMERLAWKSAITKRSQLKTAHLLAA